ncbi:stage II sporulation protein Q [Scopulibacillus darangshiensis]|uniref:Stage II sporulation protein Q n=1 Tax=Scopulibacillus darangshiensis TaxID=442528 RepID=A0A4V6NQE7_9BACL|nr:M23 family metallopeptidase [Scopulibacillus darangshiensis]TCP20266.1 stage II sporulation protein Q [Scopulibacillus darangshiensis]
MTDKNKRNPREESEGNLRKLSKKRWFYPALYLCVAALIMTAVLWFQLDDSKNQANKNNNGDVVFQDDGKDAVPVNSAKEEFKWPVAKKDAVEIVTQFYDVNGSKEDQQAALVNYDHSYTQNTGIDIAAKDKKAFDVTAAMSGKVTKAKKDSILGYVVEVKHKDGVTTLYESLASTDVKPGDKVAQDDKIGVAGRSDYNKDAGIHVHFEIRKDGLAVNPVSYFKKGISSLDDVTKASNEPKGNMPEQDKSNQDNRNDNMKSDDNKMKSNDNNMNSDDKMQREDSQDNNSQGSNAEPDSTDSSTDQNSTDQGSDEGAITPPKENTPDDSGANS